MRAKRAAVILLALGVLAGVVAGSGASLPGETVQLEGKLVVVDSGGFATGRDVHSYRLQTSRGSYDLNLRGRAAAVPRASRVVVNGSLRGNVASVVQGGLRAASISTALPQPTGTKRVAVILFNFADNTTQPYTPDYVRGTAFANPDSLAAFYRESSWSKLSLTGDVLGWYSIPDTSTTCNEDQWAADADRAAQAAGVTLSTYDYRIYAFPSVAACGWAGIADMPGTHAWINGRPSAIALAHELGHNFGLAHAVSYSCTQNGVRVALATPSSCVAGQYGDSFTVMGSAGHGQTNFARASLGWLPSTGTLDVTSSGTYSLAPLGPATTAPQAIRIKRDVNSYLLLEFRQLYGLFDNVFYPANSAVDGVLVRLVPSYGTIAQTLLVDTTSGTASFGDAALTTGRSLTDPVSGVTITTLAVSSQGASVQVTVGSGSAPGAPGDTQPPTAPTSLSASPADSTDVQLDWAPSTDNVAVVDYKVYRGGRYVATATSTDYDDNGLTPSTSYSYAVTAVDPAGNESPTSNPASTTTPAVVDTTAPTTPTGLTASALDLRTIALSWTPSTDNVGVTGYKIYRGTTYIATTGMASFTDTSLAPNTTYSYSVQAADAAGNLSANSSTAGAKTTDLVTPSVPASLTAWEVDVRHIGLNWTASSDNAAVTGYKVYRNGSYLKTVASTSLVDGTNIAPNTTYSYAVTAIDAAKNESARSNTATATTLDTTPPTAPALSAKVYNVTGASVSWTASSDNVSVTVYKLYRNGVLVATSTPGTRSFVDQNPPPGTVSYRVVAYDAAGNSTGSNTASLTF